MYSGADMKRAIENGQLKVDPYYEASLRPVGMVLHLGAELLKPLPGKTVDVKNRVTPDFKKITLTEDKPYELQPGEFVLGATYETVTVGSDIGLLLEGRSTLARVGLTIVQTAMLVYPGHTDRAITLEIVNNGVNPVLLYLKMKVARAAVFELKTASVTSYDDTGKYRNQPTVGQPIFESEILIEPEDVK